MRAWWLVGVFVAFAGCMNGYSLEDLQRSDAMQDRTIDVTIAGVHEWQGETVYMVGDSTRFDPCSALRLEETYQVGDAVAPRITFQDAQWGELPARISPQLLCPLPALPLAISDVYAAVQWTRSGTFEALPGPHAALELRTVTNNLTSYSGDQMLRMYRWERAAEPLDSFSGYVALFSTLFEDVSELNSGGPEDPVWALEWEAPLQQGASHGWHDRDRDGRWGDGDTLTLGHPSNAAWGVHLLHVDPCGCPVEFLLLLATPEGWMVGAVEQGVQVALIETVPHRIVEFGQPVGNPMRVQDIDVIGGGESRRLDASTLAWNFEDANGYLDAGDRLTLHAEGATYLMHRSTNQMIAEF